jgi:cell wall-associated NlpC family hydrolase
LLAGLLIAGAPTPALAQPDTVPDAGTRPAPAGEVPLPDGSSARFPANPDPMAGPLAGEIAATEAEITTVVRRLRELEPRRDVARQDQRDAEAAWQVAEAERTEAQRTLDDLIEEAYRDIAGVPGPLLDFPLPELAGTAVAPAEGPFGGEAAGRNVRRAVREVARADQVLRAARDAEQALATQIGTYESRLTTLQARLDDLRDRNATMLAEQEAAEQRRAAERSYPLQESVAGLRAHPRARQAVRFALGELGKPYEWGAEGPDRYDCSGLMWAAYRSVGVTLPRVAADQYQGTRARPVAQSALLPGDLIFFSRSGDWRDVHHVGMYIGEGRMVHAPNRNDVVKVSSVWWSGFFAATRVIDAVPAVGDASPTPNPSPTPPGTGASPTPPPGTGTPTPPPGTGTPPPGTGTPTPTPPPGTGTPTPSPTPSPGPTTVTVPDLADMTETEARAALTDAGLTWAEGDPVMTGSCTIGRVAGQQPAPGTRVSVGSTVTYRVCELEVPPTEGLTEDAARLALEALGFEVRIEYVVADGVPWGQVAWTDPEAGTPRFERGTVVTVYISGVEVPDVVGESEETAVATLTEADFRVEISDAGPETCSTLPEVEVPGTVACQEPAAGTAQAAGTDVTITLFPPEPATGEGDEGDAGDQQSTTEPTATSTLGYLAPRTLLWLDQDATVLV